MFKKTTWNAKLELILRLTFLGVSISNFLNIVAEVNPLWSADSILYWTIWEIGFAQSATIIIHGYGSYAYTYNAYRDNINFRSFKRFSTDAEEAMYTCPTCPYPDYLKFQEYFGKFSYADILITAAFDGTSTNFIQANADFGIYGNARSGKCSSSLRVRFSNSDPHGAWATDVVQTAIVTMSTWMYVIRYVASNGVKLCCFCIKS